MSKRILNVVTCAYRATLEEQDDPVLWLAHSMRAANAAIDVLLCGNAVSYAAQHQDASGLVFGDRRQSRPPRLADDVSALIDGSASVFYVGADAPERGIDPLELIDGLTALEPAALPDLFSKYDLILYW